MKKIGIVGIAKKLGVSTTLVSLVLNGKAKENRISDEVAERVIRLAKELNYKPNYFARNLRRGTTYTVGLIVSDISNPFFSRIARCVEDELDKSGYQLIIGSSDESADRTEVLVNYFTDKEVDGLIVAPNSQSSTIFSSLKKQNVPFVFIDRLVPKLKANYVGIDNHASMSLAVEHFIEKGYEKIAMLTYEVGSSNIKERTDGFKSTLKQNGLKVHRSFIQQVSYKNTEQDVYKAIDTLIEIENTPRAIVFATNRLGLFGLKRLITRGVRIPQDISIVSFDDDIAFQVSYPPITVIKQPYEEMAVEAAKLLIKNIASKEQLEVEQIIKKADIIVRGS